MLIGLEKSRAEAGKELSAALAVIEPFGFRADGLRALAAFVVERNK
jgi:hypothetical protein